MGGGEGVKGGRKVMRKRRNAVKVAKTKKVMREGKLQRFNTGHGRAKENGTEEGIEGMKAGRENRKNK